MTDSFCGKQAFVRNRSRLFSIENGQRPRFLLAKSIRDSGRNEPGQRMFVSSGGVPMRGTMFGLVFLSAGTMAQPAHADPYKWCAEYGGSRGGGGTNCYFMTLQQCRAAISGVGGFCRPNTFYTGPEGDGRSSSRTQRRPN
jgi:hypothetical protein